ncbi:MAG TPA: hypothetical protein VHM89_06410 [Acidimicrobiales bacterium]|nr:hypothetical protein [Acidimicrobiales bacterium]
MARLGHASPQASMIYQHAADDRDRRIAEGLDAMAGEAGSSPPEAASVETPSVSRTGEAHGRGRSRRR